jgi:hypothetical protein
LPWVILAVALAILAGTLALMTWQTSARIRGQLAGRDGEILAAVARMQPPAGGEMVEGFGSMDDPANQLAVILQISRLSGVMGARLFDGAGRFIGPFPEDVMEADLAADDLTELKRLKPVSHFHPKKRMSEIFLSEPPGADEEEEVMPVLEVSIPLLKRATTKK